MADRFHGTDDDFEPAFPHQPCGSDGLPTMEASPGMTLRDWFAGQALVAIIAADGAQFFENSRHHALTAYEHADEMLRARK